MITGLFDLTVNVSSLPRAVEFYGGLLGLRLLSESDTACVFDLGGLKLHLRSGARAHAADPHAGVVLTLRTRDIFSVHDHLRSEGVTFIGGIQHEDGGNVAHFADPDGNVHRLIQPS